MTEDESTNGHLSPEVMIANGYDIATFEDLEGLPQKRLWDIAELCPSESLDTDVCVPCRANAMAYEIRGENPAPPEEKTPEAVTETTTPVVVRFASHVKFLNHLVEEMLEGPPIPPPNVSEEELALLVVAAQRWIKITDAQGIDLGPSQQSILDATKGVVSRLHRG